MIYKILHIGLQQVNKAGKHKLKDTLIQLNDHNIPEFFTTPSVLVGVMPLKKTAGVVKNYGTLCSFHLILNIF